MACGGSRRDAGASWARRWCREGFTGASTPAASGLCSSIGGDQRRRQMR
jgi:hypothetical protein